MDIVRKKEGDKAVNFITKEILRVSVMIIVFTGIIPSVYFDNWVCLSRSGSLLTMYGIWLAFNDLIGTMRYTDEEFEKLDPHTATGQVQADNYVVWNRRTAKMEPSVKRADFLVLISGTFIWGYGDLFNHLFQITECTPCTP